MHLIQPEELRALLGDPELRILDARIGADAAERFAAAHLPGALHAHLERDLSRPTPHPERGGRHPLPDPADFAAVLGAWGVTPATRVVVLDEQAGANAGARLWWMLRAAGHERVQLLDGGAAGLPQVSGASAVAAAPPYPFRAWRLPIVDIEEVERARHDPARRLLDARAAFRYRGESEPFDPVAGHIPGAASAPYGDNLDAGGRFRPAAELRARYLELLGAAPPEGAIVYCGSGVTACHDLVALELAGLSGAALYVGSWGEWCRQGRPVAKMIP